MDTFNIAKKGLDILKESNYKSWLAFGLGIVILAGLCALFFFQSVTSSVNKNNRCKLVRDRYVASGVFTVEERAANNTPLYAVHYNLATRSTTSECRCPKGETYNKFDFHVRDQFNNETRETSLNCSCDDDYYGLVRITDKSLRNFQGYPELVNYMRDPRNDAFFRTGGGGAAP